MWPMEKRGAEPLRLRPLGVCLRYVRFIYKSGYGPPGSSQLALLYIAHMPVHPEKAPADAMVLPGCRVLSALYYGDYNGLDEAWLALGREVKARGLTPADFPRALGIVAPYMGREIETRRYCSRLALPVER